MKNYSFRVIVTLTLIIVIGLVSSLAFFFYYSYVEDHIYSEIGDYIEESFGQLEDPSIDEVTANILKRSIEWDHREITHMRVASILTTIAIVVIIIILILFLHYQYVRKSLREFHDTIDAVNSGDLSRRLRIPETKELGVLAGNFNNMLDTLQKTQDELKEFHRRELRNKYKLATIGEMSARLAHELRNPLMGIASATEIMGTYLKKEENKEILEEIQRQAKRANHAIDDLLKYSGKKIARLSLNNINDVIESVVNFLKNQDTEKNIELITELHPDIPLLNFDSEQMEDVLLNLGSNAANAIEKSGVIIFSTVFRASDNELIIHVSDNGKGIPEDKLGKVFQPFYTTRTAGTGLGLAIVKDIIELHNGEISVVNNVQGGCTFTINLPMEKDPLIH